MQASAPQWLWLYSRDMPSTSLTALLPRLCYDAGPLIAVEHAYYSDDDARFVSAIRLQFESLAAVLRALPDDDTITAFEGDLLTEPGEKIIETTNSSVWAEHVGKTIVWAWSLTNQQGYEDGVRLEFQPGNNGVEMLVVASTIKLFEFTRASESGA